MAKYKHTIPCLQKAHIRILLLFLVMSNIAKQTTELKWYFDSSNKAQQLSKWNYYYLIVFRLWYDFCYSAVLKATHSKKLIFSVQQLTKIEAWLLLTFFMCFSNHLSSIHSIVTYQKAQMFEKGDPSNRHLKWTVTPFSEFYGKILVGFCPNTGKRFFLELSIKNQ